MSHELLDRGFEPDEDVDFFEIAQRPENAEFNPEVEEMEPTSFQRWVSRLSREELIRRGLLTVNTLQDANDVVAAWMDEGRRKREYEEWIQAKLDASDKARENLKRRYWPEISRLWNALRTGKKKSEVLPAGKIGFTKPADKLLVDDEAKLLAWCRASLPSALILQLQQTHIGKDAAQLMDVFERDGFVVPTIGHLKGSVLLSYSKAMVNQHWKNTGKVPDGCTELKDREEEFFVKEIEPKQSKEKDVAQETEEE